MEWIIPSCVRLFSTGDTWLSFSHITTIHTCCVRLFSTGDTWLSFFHITTIHTSLFLNRLKSKLKRYIYLTLNYNPTIINTWLSSHCHQDTDHANMQSSKPYKILIYLQKAHVTKLYNKIQSCIATDQCRNRPHANMIPNSYISLFQFTDWDALSFSLWCSRTVFVTFEQDGI
jgi:hypothetical protein